MAHKILIRLFPAALNGRVLGNSLHISKYSTFVIVKPELMQYFNESNLKCAINMNCAINLNTCIKHISWGKQIIRKRSSSNVSSLDHVSFEKVVGDTLENLTEFIELLDECERCPQAFDVEYSDGVLTVILGKEHGTYVINKQTPNKQIWLSSPTSGPKRYDLLNGQWIYSHDGRTLHELLTEEFSAIFKQNIDFKNSMHK